MTVRRPRAIRRTADPLCDAGKRVSGDRRSESTPACRTAGRRTRSKDRGASAIELALLTPIILLTITAAVQFALLFHARHVALAAAQEGARVARTTTGPSWQDAAVRRANTYIDLIGPRLLEERRVTPIAAGDDRGVQVRGHAVNVLPFLELLVVERSSGPRECFRPDDGGAGQACR